LKLDSGTGLRSWGLNSESDVEAIGGDVVLVEDEPAVNPAAGDGFNWEAYNRQKRQDAVAFAASRPGPILVVMGITLNPQVHLMNMVLQRSSEGWIVNNSFEVLKNNTCRLPIADAHRRVLTNKYFGEVLQLLHDESKWMALRPAHRTHYHRSLAYGVLTKAAGGIAQHMVDPQDGYFRQ
jgi:hypothetical protein